MADTMTVTVRDNDAETRNWGNGRGGIIVALAEVVERGEQRDG